MDGIVSLSLDGMLTDGKWRRSSSEHGQGLALRTRKTRPHLYLDSSGVLSRFEHWRDMFLRRRSDLRC